MPHYDEGIVDYGLSGVRESLLGRLRVPLGPEDGEVAFERHILLAVRFHHAAGLNQTVVGQGAGWRQYFEEHFPKRSEWRAEDAGRLWEHWRVGLVKEESPRSGVTVTHGQPDTHWFREPGGTLCINLESMWDDFEQSVESFLELLERDSERREIAIARWRERSWIVRQLVVSEGHRIYAFGLKPARAVTGTSVGTPTTMSTPPVQPGSHPR